MLLTHDPTPTSCCEWLVRVEPIRCISLEPGLLRVPLNDVVARIQQLVVRGEDANRVVSIVAVVTQQSMLYERLDRISDAIDMDQSGQQSGGMEHCRVLHARLAHEALERYARSDGKARIAVFWLVVTHDQLRRLVEILLSGNGHRAESGTGVLPLSSS